MASILTVGVATVDEIYLVERYPVEDTKCRATERRRARGGNAANTAVTLANLGHDVGWAGALGSDDNASFVRRDLVTAGVQLEACSQHDATTPLSVVLLSASSSSRTVIHHRMLPEYGYSDFAGAALGRYQWVHFELREPAETELMLARCRRANLRVSLELERARDGFETLLTLPDLIFAPRALAHDIGCSTAKAVLEFLRPRAPQAWLVSSWGDQGAWALAPCQSEAWHASATATIPIVDTLGAGDVFNAGIVSAMLEGVSGPEMLVRACALAGAKCGRYGL